MAQDRVAGQLLAPRQEISLITGVLMPRPSPPFLSLDFMVTSRCNVRCRFCSCWEGGDQAEDLAPELWVDTARRLKELARIDSVCIGGGEPLLYKGLERALEGLSALGVSPGLITNGALLNQKRAEALVKAGASWVNFSLDGLEHTHDDLRRTPGLFKRVVQGISLLKEAQPDLRVCLSTIICGLNIAELPRFTEWALGATAVDGINFQAYTQVTSQEGPGWWKMNPLWPSDPEATRDALDKLIAMKVAGAAIVNPAEQLEKYKDYFLDPDQDLRVRCLAGAMNYAVDAAGEVRGCIKDQPVGNITRDDPLEIYLKGFAPTRRMAATCPDSCHFRLNCFFPERWQSWLDGGGAMLEEADREVIARGEGGGRSLPEGCQPEVPTIYLRGHQAKVHCWGENLRETDFQLQVEALGGLSASGEPYHTIVGIHRGNFHQAHRIIAFIRQVRGWGDSPVEAFSLQPRATIAQRFQEHLQRLISQLAAEGVEVRAVDDQLDPFLDAVQAWPSAEGEAQRADIHQVMRSVCRDLPGDQEHS